ncbi:MAG: hypothetical protein JWL96_2647 [Sphingomonas bacterium]|nr:hypothetical protein [Sphingomonas bacterium]
MMRLSRTRAVAIAVAFFIAGIAIGFVIPRPAQFAPLSSAGHDRFGHATSQSTGRNVYSPDIRHDEYVLREQLKVVEMLEQQCRTTKKGCDLAGAARQALTRNLRQRSPFAACSRMTAFGVIRGRTERRVLGPVAADNLSLNERLVNRTQSRRSRTRAPPSRFNPTAIPATLATRPGPSRIAQVGSAASNETEPTNACRDEIPAPPKLFAKRGYSRRDSGLRARISATNACWLSPEFRRATWRGRLRGRRAKTPHEGRQKS